MRMRVNPRLKWSGVGAIACHGVLSRLLSDSGMGDNLHTTVANLKKGSEGLKENMEAAKHNFLLRGYFKKKKRVEEKKKKSN